MSTPNPDPVLELLKELIAKQDEVAAKQVEMETTLARTLATITKSGDDRKSAERRIELAVQETQASLATQDTRITALDQRIAGNHDGVKGALGIVGDELSRYNTNLEHVEAAVVDVGRTTRILHGRLIEESGSVRGKIVQSEREIVEIDRRLGLAERGLSEVVIRVGKSDPPAIERVEAVGER